MPPFCGRLRDGSCHAACVLGCLYIASATLHTIMGDAATMRLGNSSLGTGSGHVFKLMTKNSAFAVGVLWECEHFELPHFPNFSLSPPLQLLGLVPPPLVLQRVSSLIVAHLTKPHQQTNHSLRSSSFTSTHGPAARCTSSAGKAGERKRTSMPTRTSWPFREDRIWPAS